MQIVVVVVLGLASLLSACMNPLPHRPMDAGERQQWLAAERAFAGAMRMRSDLALDEPLVFDADPESFEYHCLHTACSVGEAGKCAHACAHLHGNPLIVLDGGHGPDYGDWVFVHESIHHIAYQTGRHSDGDYAHADQTMWNQVMWEALRASRLGEDPEDLAELRSAD